MTRIVETVLWFVDICGWGMGCDSWMGVVGNGGFSGWDIWGMGVFVDVDLWEWRMDVLVESRNLKLKQIWIHIKYHKYKQS